MTAKIETPAGTRFGILTVLHEDTTPPAGDRCRTKYVCRCDCGVVVSVIADKLRHKQRSCGCLNLGSRTHGGTVDHALTHSTWVSMRRRCNEPTHKDYDKYSKLGYDKAWDDFAIFLACVGERPSLEHTLDRKDNSIGYFPGNVRWATWTTQQRNRTNNQIILYKGKPITLAEAVDISKLSRTTVHRRLAKKGYPLSLAMGSDFSWPNRTNPYTGRAE